MDLMHHVSNKRQCKGARNLRNMATTANRVRERSFSLDIPNEIQCHIVGKNGWLGHVIGLINCVTCPERKEARLIDD